MDSPTPDACPSRGGRPSADLFVAVALLVPLLAAHAAYYAYTSDDAFISFRYAHNLARGLGLVYNPGERVEGYSNFLWTVLLAGARTCGLDVESAARIGGLACAAATLLVTVRLGRELAARPAWLRLLPAVLLVAAPPFALWAQGGLETPLYTLLVTTAIALEAGARPGRGLIAAGVLALATLTRPDGVLFLAVSLLTAAVARPGWAGLRAAGARLATFLAIVLPYFAWRLHEYGWLLPNTFYAKSGGGPTTWARGLLYLGGFAVDTGWGLTVLPVAAWATLRHRHDPRRWLLAGGIAANAVFVVFFGGDQLVMYRFLVPVMPLAAVLFSDGLDEARRAGRARGAAGWQPLLAGLACVTVALTLRPGLTGPQIERVVAERESFRDTRVIGAWLRRAVPPTTRIAVILAGILPFESELPTIDMLGLTDEHIAHVRVTSAGSGEAGHEKHDSAYVLAQHPDLIFMAPLFLRPRLPTKEAVLEHYLQFSHWAPGNRTLLADPLLWREYSLVAFSLPQGYFFAFARRGFHVAAGSAGAAGAGPDRPGDLR